MSDAPSSHDFGLSIKPVETLESVVIRFAGDSGDGIQLTGSQFTAASAAAGNDTATFPDYPAEIRAPVGTLAGVSGFQLHFSSKDILTPGDRADVLVVMNPAALMADLGRLEQQLRQDRVRRTARFPLEIACHVGFARKRRRGRGEAADLDRVRVRIRRHRVLDEFRQMAVAHQEQDMHPVP